MKDADRVMPSSLYRKYKKIDKKIPMAAIFGWHYTCLIETI